MFQQRHFLLVAQPGDFVQHRFLNPTLPEFLVVRIGEPVRLVAQPLNQMQRRRFARQLQRLRHARLVNFLHLFRQPDDR